MKMNGSKLSAIIFIVVVGAAGADAQEIILSSRYCRSDTCRILFADSSGLAIWRSDLPYNSENAPKYRAWLEPTEISRIIVPGKSRLWSGVGLGFLAGVPVGAILGAAPWEKETSILDFRAVSGIIGGFVVGIAGAIVGGAIGASQGLNDNFVINGRADSYLAVLPKLESISMYKPPAQPDKFPPESDAYAAKRSEPLPPEETRFPAPSITRFHFSAGGDICLFGPASGSITHAFDQSGFGGMYTSFFGSTDYPIDGGNSLYWNLSGEYSLFRNLRLGFSWSNSPITRFSGIDDVFEDAQSRSYVLVCTYVPSPAEPFMAARWEFGVTAGLSYNILYAGGSLSAFHWSDAPYTPPTEFSVKKKALGCLLRLSYDYYLSRYLSLQVGVGGHYIPSSIDVPAEQYTKLSDGSTKELIPHSINLSGLDLTTAIRIHL